MEMSRCVAHSTQGGSIRAESPRPPTPETRTQTMGNSSLVEDRDKDDNSDSSDDICYALNCRPEGLSLEAFEISRAIHTMHFIYCINAADDVQGPLMIKGS